MNAAPFSARAIGGIVAAAVVGFAAFLLLTAYGPDLRPGRDGGAHALSTSATGFKAIVDLQRAVNGTAPLIRDPARLDSPALVVATPGSGTTPAAMRALLDARGDRPTLIVLPKWQTRALRTNPSWVERIGLLPPEDARAPLSGIVPVTLCRDGDAQFECGTRLEPLSTVAGRTLVARVPGHAIWILAEPDLLSNQALRTLAGTRRARALLARVTAASDTYSTAFDLTLNGFARRPNLLRLAFDPPFLSLTLCLLAAVALAVFHAAVRFGTPRREGRALAFGKAALVENVAALLHLARRSHRTGGAYATLVAEEVARATGSRLTGDPLAAYLDRLGSGPAFTALAADAAAAGNDDDLLAAARALHHWKETVH